MAHLVIQLLGSFRVTLKGHPVTIFESDRARALLAYLAVDAERPQRREKLVGLLWPDWPERSARQNLSQALYNLRAAIGDRTAEPPFLLISPKTIQFNEESDYSLDAAQLAGLRDEAPVEQLEAAAASYHGPFLADFSLPDSVPFEEWVITTREAILRKLLLALGRLASHYQAAGDLGNAIGYARRAVALDPCSEGALRGLMQLLAQSGDRGAALAQYESGRDLLQRELGVEPAAETVALYERIRTGGLALAPSRSAEIEPHVPDWLAQEREVHPRPVFVGRERQLAQLEYFLAAAVEERGQVAFITGGPGRGKSALMQAFACRAVEAHADLLVAAGHCSAFAGAGDPYLPFRHLLSMLTGDVQARLASGTIGREGATRLWDAIPRTVRALADHGRDLIDVMVPGRPLLERIQAAVPNSALVRGVNELVGRERPLPGELAQVQLFEQVVQLLRSLAAEQPLLLLLDDMQWADSASIGLLFHLGRELGGDRILIVGAYRPEEVALGRRLALSGETERHPLEKVLAELKRQYGEVWLDLTKVQELEGQDFVDAFLDSEFNRLGDDFHRTLFRHTGGHPLFTVELMRAMQERGDLLHDEEDHWVEGPSLDWAALPARVEGVIEERIGRLDEELREILTVASVEGEDFTAQVVAQVGEMQERQLLRRLSRELEGRHRLVREEGEAQVGERFLSRYRFVHTLTQRYLYSELSVAERRFLHRGMRAALEALYGEEADVIAPQLARHHHEAGEPEKAIPYLLSMGDRARLAYAYEEAADAYQRAVALQKAGSDWDGAARTLLILGLTQHSAFKFREARQAYDEGFALGQSGARNDETPSAPAPHPFRAVPRAMITELDPANKVGWSAATPLIFSGLVRSAVHAGVEPEVARRWEVLDGGRQYLFHLRDDWCWSDGAPVTAGDFEYAWKRALDPTTGAIYPLLLYDIEGARAFHQGQHADPSRVGVRALDDMSLLVELEEPTGYFLQLLGNDICKPVPQHVVEMHGDGWTELENLVTNGPFRLTAWRPGESILFSRNPAYAGRFRGNLQEVELVLSLEGWDAELAAYEAGDLDQLFLGVLPATELGRVRQRHAREYALEPEPSVAYIYFDTSRPPFDDVRVRRALVMAANRERVVDMLGGGFVIPATGGIVPPGLPGHSAGIGLPYDPGRARELLAEAGYRDGSGFSAVVARTYNVDFMGERFLAHWRENLGIEIELQVVDFEQFAEGLRSDPPHLAFGGWIADYPDPDSFLRVAVNLSRILPWSHAAYDKLVEEARRLMNQGERMKLYRQADTILMQEAYLMPTYYWRPHCLVKPWVKYPASSVGQDTSRQDFIIEPH